MPSPSIPTVPKAALLDLRTLDRYLLSLLLPPDDSESLLLKYRDVVLDICQVATILVTQGQTPAAKILGLSLRAPRYRIIVYAMLSCLAPRLYQPVKDWYLKQQDASAVLSQDNVKLGDKKTSAAGIEAIGHGRRLAAARRLIFLAERVGPILRLGLLIGCWKGVVTTPDTLLFLSGCRVESSPKGSPTLHVDFAHRRWLYENAIETFKAVFGGLSLLGVVWKPLIQGTGRNLASLAKTISGEEPSPTNVSCPCCQRDPPTIPVISDCGHIYCYTCLCNASAGKTMFHCVLCGIAIKKAFPAK